MTSRSNCLLLGRLLAGALLFGTVPAQAAGERVVHYLDGARIEQVVAARKGNVVVPLPPDMIPGSLRLEPVGKTVIDRVAVTPPPAPKTAQLGRQQLIVRRDALEDRLAALAVKEEIFKSAAKAQSGKAPKKTKTNPDPLATIRQGTEYAVAQLEAVYRSRRSAERELAEVKRRLAVLAGDPAAVGSQARIALRGGDRVKVSYLVRGRNWTPHYDLRLLPDGKAELSLWTDAGAATVVPAQLASAAAGAELPVAANGVVLQLSCVTRREEPLLRGQLQVAVEVACTPPMILPRGEASCYYRGTYLGEVPLPSFVSGGAVKFACGGQAADLTDAQHAESERNKEISR